MNVTLGKLIGEPVGGQPIYRRAIVRISNRVNRDDIEHLLPKAERSIGRLANVETIMRVARRNEDSVWLLFRENELLPSGFQSTLLLNCAGREALISGEMTLADPQDEFLCHQTERPALIYVWAVFAPGRTALALAHVIDRFASPHYIACDVAANVRTVAGARAIARLGFEKWSETGANNLAIVRRSAQSIAANRSRFDCYDPISMPTGITVAHSTDEFFQVTAIRAAVFMGEQDCPYREEFDGNDFSATHLIAYVDGEPAGCMRIRFFGEFAKLERLAVRREFRKSRTAFKLVRAGVDLCREKGFRKLYGHARVDLLRFWESFGFKLKEDARPFDFSNLSFVEMVHDIEPTKDAIKIDDGPYRTIRPEGCWQRPGVLETSAVRGSQ